jgi:hypothetical protein
MPTRKAIELAVDNMELSISVQAGSKNVVLTVRIKGSPDLVQEIPVNDFKDFIGMLGDLKPSMTRLVFAPAPSKEPRENPFDHYIKEYEVTC